MNVRTATYAGVATLAFTIACASGIADRKTDRSMPGAASEKVPPFAMLIEHRVADYDAWKSIFDDHRSSRQESSLSGHHLERDVDDPNMVTIYFPGNDLGRMRAFMDSADLVETMKRAGVQGQPTVTLVQPVTEELLPDAGLAEIIIKHPVRDYDAWRAAYDGFDAYRKRNGIVGHAVLHELGDPNVVIVYHQARDVETLRAFVASQELKETMQRAGVLGEPDIRFVQVADSAAY